MRVLVIDDNDLVREGARMVLEDAGHEVVTVESGEVGLGLLEGGGFDAVLCDLDMPTMSGLEVWRRLPEGMRGRFVMWTAAPVSVEGVPFQVLAKPVSMTDLRDAVSRAGGS